MIQPLPAESLPEDEDDEDRRPVVRVPNHED
jgi:hypothetical protein